MRGWLGGILAAVLAGLAGAAMAQAPAERRVVAEDDTDLFGGDIRSMLGTDYPACVNACLAEPACRAFTFNSRANACFLKDRAGAASRFAGAVSGRVLESPPPPADRVAALDFLPEGYLVAARRHWATVGAFWRANDRSAEAMRGMARDARQAGDAAAVVGALGGVAAVTDTGADWTAFATAQAESVDPEDWRSRETLAQAVSGAIRGFLRGETPALRAQALRTMAGPLGALGAGRQAIAALRLAQAQAPTAEGQATLDAALDRWGFRIVDHRAESDAASPRICLDFSEPLLRAGVDYGDYLRVEGMDAAVEADGRALCVEGLEHGRRYRLTARSGLPSAAGEALRRPVSLELYVRDRSPSVRFAGRAHVLPKAGLISIPIVGVNADRAALRIHRVGERNLLRAIQTGLTDRGLDTWEEARLGREIGAPVWEGEAELARELNRDVTTALPLGEAVARFEPGLYVMTARLPGVTEPWDAAATQWFVVTDLGLSALGAEDGLHVGVRALSTASPVAGARVALLSAGNEVLATAETDAAGNARFPAGLTRGRAALAPALVTVEAGEDFAFLDIARPGFDLSDRGVEGRAAPGPVDVFLTTERGVWRPGETVHALVLARDGQGAAVEGLPLTAVLSRPDGVEHARAVLADAGAGGRVWAVPLPAAAQRGPWRLRVHVDPAQPPLAETAVLVEDFVPERLALSLALPEGPVDWRARPALGLTARWLYGAPGAGLKTEVETRLAAVRELPGWPGFRFGLDDEPAIPAVALAAGPLTGEDGAASAALPRPEIAAGTRPLRLTAIGRALDPSGRAVERAETRPLVPQPLVLGVRPLFEGDLDEGAEAAFEVAAVGPTLAAVDGGTADWALFRVETNFQWYSTGGGWEWEPIETRSRVASGRLTLTAATPARLAVPVTWGRYELRVSRPGTPPVAASVAFSAGWRGAGTVPGVPDRLAVGLDRAAYRVGETARLRIAARSAGRVVVSVVDTRLIVRTEVAVTPGETVVDLPVTEAWGAGAYVVASLVRPMDGPATREPVRAMGLVWAPVDPGPRRLNPALEAPAEVRPRGPLDVDLTVPGLAAGERAFVTVAAVDAGILGLTGFEPPAPDAWAFGQRRLGARLHDLYGALIDAGAGVPGRLRSGGDGGVRLKGEPPEGETVAFFSGIVEVDAQGRARVRFDLPDFNGTVRLMAVAWTAAGLGHATADVLVRDPVVARLSAPRFLAPGDTARVMLDLAHVAGPSGPVAVAVEADGALAAGAAAPVLDLAAQGRASLAIPVTAGAEAGEGLLAVSLTLPGGERVTRRLALPVRALDPEVVRREPVLVSPGASVRVGAAEVFRPGAARATLSIGAAAAVDAAGLLAALDRYPFGCTEQITSRALPLLAAAPLAEALGEGGQPFGERIAGAIAGVLANQTGSGGFGLWRPEQGEMWLDAFVTDFLSRARTAGHAMPAPAFAAALANLRAQIGYAADFDRGGEGLAYALYVLAREGQASIADLRYFADEKGDAFATPLARAQLGAALAAYGEQRRADAMFRLAVAGLGQGDGGGMRADFGSPRRDAAGVAALAAEARSEAVDRDAILSGLAAAGPLSTQEMAWTVLAVQAAVAADAASGGLLVDGLPAGPVLRLPPGTASATLENRGPRPVPVVLTAAGAPAVPAAPGGQGYAVERAWFDLSGARVAADTVAQGTRLVAVLTVRADAHREGRLVLVDPLPAGLEIDNPSLMRSGDVAGLGWLNPGDPPAHVEFRADRLVAALDWNGERVRQVAYVVRAVTPGRFHHPAPSVEDMYRPEWRAVGATGAVTVTGR